METDKLEKLKTLRARISTRISQVAARKQAEKRKLETRRKIIAGGILLKEVDQDAILEKQTGIAQWWKRKLDKIPRPQDRQLFEPALPPTMPQTKETLPTGTRTPPLTSHEVRAYTSPSDVRAKNGQS